MACKVSLIVGLLILLPNEYVTQDRLTPEIKVEDEKVYIGSDVTLNCNIDQSFSNYLKVSTWFTDDGLIFLVPTTLSTSSDSEGIRPRRRQIVLTNGALFIYNITQRDVARKYRCQVRSLLTGERIDSIGWSSLNIIGPSKSSSPIVNSERPSNKYIRAQEGDILILNCPIIGFPRPTIRWFKYNDNFIISGDGTSFSGNNNNKGDGNYNNNNNGYINTIDGEQLPVTSHLYPESIMVIPRLTSRDSGRYQCTGNNTFGQNHFEMTIILKKDQSVSIISNNPEPNLGSDVTLNCSLHTSTPSINNINGFEYHHFNDRSNKINNHNPSNNNNNNKKTSNIIIKEVKWFKNMSQLSHDNRISIKDAHQLTIRSIRYTDNGIYQCFIKTYEFEGSHHEKWHQASITLKIPEKGPTFGTVFPEQIKITGTQLSLKCLAYGSPIPSLRWTIDGKHIDNGLSRSNLYGYMTTDGKGFTSFLNISSLTVQDGGTYECSAENSVGSISHSARIDIMGPPGIKPMDNVTAIMGQTYQLYCPYTGYPVDEVYFTKGNRRLPFDERHIHVGLGKINILSVSKEDASSYKCTVSSLNGERYESNIYLHVVAPPILSPFAFPGSLEEGMRISIMCSVIAGDPPITITWLKDGHQLYDRSGPNPSIHLVSLTEYVSSLIIENLNKSDSGNYTCSASNAHSWTSYSAQLVVKSKPHFTLSPIARTSISDLPVLFNCQADGVPSPVIRWKFQRSFGPSEPIAILSSPRVHVLENGSLHIRTVSPEDEGTYLCEASNGLGKSISVSAFLKVHEPPKIRPVTSKSIIKYHERAELICQASGSVPMVIEWFKNGNPIQGDDDGGSGSKLTSNYGVREEDDAKFKISILTIHSSNRNDSALFICNAINFYGSAQTIIKVIVQEPADPPDNLKATQIKSNSATVSWSVNYNGNSPILGFLIDYRTASETWTSGKTLYISDTTANTAIINDLSPSTSYYFRIAAENIIGRSEFSQELFFITRMEAPKVVPENITAVPLDSKSIRISWILRRSMNELDNHSRRGTIDGFYIGYKPASTQLSFTFSTMHLPDNGNVENTSSDGLIHVSSSATSYSSSSSEESIYSNTNVYHNRDLNKFQTTIYALKKSTKYAIIVQAFNKEGEGPYSDQIVVETFANDPPKAPKLSFESSTSDSASLIWSIGHHADQLSPDSIHGFILSYRCNKSDPEVYDDIRLPKNYRRYHLSNLLCGSTYIAKLCAFNEVGKGEPSNEIHFKTEGSVPKYPEKDAFITINITMVTLWLANWSDGKCPIDYFEVQYKPQFQPEWILHSNRILPDSRKTNITEIMPGTWYDLLVIAKNEAGTTEAKYLFATLDVTGATVAPLLFNDSGKSMMEGLLILIPSISAIIVLILVALFAIYIVFLRPQRDSGQSDLYGTHQGADSVSLHSYNKATKGEPLYDHQRVYCTSVYSTGNNTVNNDNLEIRDNPGQLQCSLDDEYHRFVLDNRVPRKGFYDHIYDVPHRHQKIFTGLH